MRQVVPNGSPVANRWGEPAGRGSSAVSVERGAETMGVPGQAGVGVREAVESSGSTGPIPYRSAGPGQHETRLGQTRPQPESRFRLGAGRTVGARIEGGPRRHEPRGGVRRVLAQEGREHVAAAHPVSFEEPDGRDAYPSVMPDDRVVRGGRKVLQGLGRVTAPGAEDAADHVGRGGARVCFEDAARPLEGGIRAPEPKVAVGEQPLGVLVVGCESVRAASDGRGPRGNRLGARGAGRGPCEAPRGRG